MSNDDLVEIIERQVGKSHILADGNPSWNGDYRFWVHGETARDDYIKILNFLPAIIEDHLAMTGLLDKLLGVVAEQQIEIARLSSEIEEVRNASITVKAQANMHDLINKLAEKGCDITDAEIKIGLEGSSSHKTEDVERREERSSENEAWKTNVAGGIGTILKQLGELSFGYDRQTSKAVRMFKKLKSLRNRDVERSYKGYMHMKFGSIKRYPKDQS